MHYTHDSFIGWLNRILCALEVEEACKKRTKQHSFFPDIHSHARKISYSTTVCPRSSDPFYIVHLLYKRGHYFLDRR